ncbi:hypothetical protein V490_01261 [Pseudogymnoascus sp. VKM F-3557]|nr:hypothetical protein V490_01261 [Pseudogymnoascus sp. VKM F-3557]
MTSKMEVDLAPSPERNFFDKEKRAFHMITSICSIIADGYKFANRSCRQTEKLLASQDIVTLQDHRNTFRDIILDNEDNAWKAANVVGRLHSEMKIDIATAVKNLTLREVEEAFSRDVFHDTLRDMLVYVKKWAKALSDLEQTLEVMKKRGKQLRKVWERTEKLIEEMAKGIEDVAKGTDEGSNMFHQILTSRLKEFGREEIEDVLDAFVASQEYEAGEAEKVRKEEAEGAEKARRVEERVQVFEVLDKAREEFQGIFDDLKKELEELKDESEELRGELRTLKQCGWH